MQFFAIPIGSLSSGTLIDNFFEPFMSQQNSDSIICAVYGARKGSGTALLMAFLGVAGVALCGKYSLLLKKEKFDND